ncbi:hypothetical protein PAMA_022009 [Pampus argenteus]
MKNPWVKVDTIAADESLSQVDLGGRIMISSIMVPNGAIFPETLSGAESTSLVAARGVCVLNGQEVDVPIKLYCNSNGEWMVPIGRCMCKAGYEALENGTVSRGFFKAAQGDHRCLQYPINSRTTSEGATNCVCHNSYYRSESDPPQMPFTKKQKFVEEIRKQDEEESKCRLKQTSLIDKMAEQEKEEKRAAMLQAVSAHCKAKIQERDLRQKEEEQSNLE